eukprot:TRINITY_DN7642_c0_g1_i6.p1 TRINITY_DN7642_c0_g1~~TRINITY_DN7642_c0_g1_i6.p1  ORF type:complete len:229 (-),score=40.20 TRINITY_DN7642_c0_g1_i6:92-778(-)
MSIAVTPTSCSFCLLTISLSKNLSTIFMARKRVSSFSLNFKFTSTIQSINIALIFSLTSGCMLIASKYEEIYPPEIKDFIYICDSAYNKSEIILMEQQILKMLNFSLNVTSPYRFLKCFNYKINPGAKAYNMALYLIELSLMEYKFLKYKPSLCAASALYLANRLVNKDLEWDKKAKAHYKEAELRQCAKELAVMTQGAASSSLNAVRKKYAQAKYMGISSIRIGRRS